MVHEWYDNTLGERTAGAFRKNGFDAKYFPKRSGALDYIAACINKDTMVGLGGSMTVAELGIRDIAREKGAILLDHTIPGISPEEKFSIMRRQVCSDLFISSSNALTEKGELVNVDHAGNRVAALVFGPKRTIVVAGLNKIVPDEGSAFKRIAMCSAPMNNKRLNRANPCVQTGQCVDCSSPERICRSYCVIRKKPALSEFSILIIGETLGY